MNYYAISAALVITFLFILLFSVFFKRPLRGFALFFLILFLATWSGQLWISPFGPMTYGISWLPLFFTALLFSSLILAMSTGLKRKEEGKSEEPIIAAGFFFWIIIILLIITIITGHFRSLPDVPEYRA